MSMTNQTTTPKVAIHDALEAEILGLMLTGSVRETDEVTRRLEGAAGTSTDVRAALERLSLD